MSILTYNSWNLSFGSVEEKMNREGSIRMIICKRSFYPVDHLQEVFLSCWSFAIDWSIQMIICKRPVIPDDHLRDPVHRDDHLRKAGPSGWTGLLQMITGLTGLLQMIIRIDRPLANDHLHGSVYCKWSSLWTDLLQMIIRNDWPLANDHM